MNLGFKKVLAAAVLTFSLFIAPISVHASSWDNVILTNNYLSDYYLEHNEMSTMHATIGNYTPDNANLFVWVALMDHNHNVVKEMSWDNVWINAWQSHDFWLDSPNNLMPGMYHFSVAVYTAGKGTLIHKYDGAQMFTVALDYSAPELNVTWPSDGSTVWGNFKVQGWAADWESGVDWVDVYVRETNTHYTASYDSSSHTFWVDIPTSGWANGYKGFDVFAYNMDGMKSQKYFGINWMMAM